MLREEYESQVLNCQFLFWDHFQIGARYKCKLGMPFLFNGFTEGTVPINQ
jgi:hypothetical protein